MGRVGAPNDSERKASRMKRLAFEPCGGLTDVVPVTAILRVSPSVTLRQRRHCRPALHASVCFADGFLVFEPPIGDNYARRYLRKNLVAHFVICHTYYIPKENVIDFVLSLNYLTVLNRFRRDNK